MIVIDATCITSVTCGYQVFATQLLKHLLPKLAGQNVRVLTGPDCPPEIGNEITDAGGEMTFTPTSLPVMGPRRLLAYRTSFPGKLLSNARLYHCLHTNPLPVPKRILSLATVHDFSALVLPAYFARMGGLKRAYLRWEYRFLLSRMTQVIAVSQSTADDARRLGIFKAGKLTVIPEGIKAFTPSFAPARPKPFFLGMGSRPHKNIPSLLEAFSLLLSRSALAPGTELVIVGKKDAGTQAALNHLSPLVQQQVTFIANIDDTELASLFQHCVAFVFPSLYEGFGLPVLEAMSHGAPVITSNTSSLPEVAGDAALLVDPRDSHAMAKQMKDVATQDDLRQVISLKGKKRSRQFSWQKVADQYYDLYAEFSAISI